jgi:tetratricopeptide (TPR) repeat protein
MGWTELRGLRTARWKYIRAPEPELYDLVSDPAETRNVIASHPKEARELDARLAAVVGNRGPEKVETAVLDRTTMQQLKSLGYSAGFAEREYTLTGQGVDPKDRTDVLKWLYLAVSPDARTPAAQRLGLLKQALARDPGNPSIYLHLGDEYQRAGRARDALALYEQGVEHGVRAAWLYSRLGFLRLQQGNKDGAIAAYERAAQLNPSDCESLNDLGLTYLETGRPKEAQRVLAWCLATEPENALAHNGLGLVAIRRQDLLGARNHFEKAVQFDPDLLEAYLNLGRIYKMLGGNTRARECFETFLAKASPAQYGHIIPRIREEVAALR